MWYVVEWGCRWGGSLEIWSSGAAARRFSKDLQFRVFNLLDLFLHVVHLCILYIYIICVCVSFNFGQANLAEM